MILPKVLRMGLRQTSLGGRGARLTSHDIPQIRCQIRTVCPVSDDGALIVEPWLHHFWLHCHYHHHLHYRHHIHNVQRFQKYRLIFGGNFRIV